MANGFEKLKVAPTYQVVSDAIEREILKGRLRPGDQLPTEFTLAEQFGVNRSTVREGIRQLEQSGLVRREGGRRLHVALPHHAELAPRLSRAMVVQRVTFREMWEVLIDLEPKATELAAARITDQDIGRLDRNLAATEEALARGRSIIPLDLEFHAMIAEIAGNRALLMAREPISALFYPALSALFEQPETSLRAQQRLIDAHRQVLEALRRRDVPVAREWMRKHIVDFKRGYDLCGLDIDAAVEALPAALGLAG